MLQPTGHTALTQQLLWAMPRYRTHPSKVRSIDSSPAASVSWRAWFACT